MVNDGLNDSRPEGFHPLSKPGGHATAVQRKIGEAGAFHESRPSLEL
jgi:hypothetical protein